MTKSSRKELLGAIKARYLRADVPEKTEILNEFCKATGYHRKYATRILQAGYQYRSWDNKRTATHRSDILAIIIRIWELLEYPCGARLKPQLLPMTEALIRTGGMKSLSGFARTQLQTIRD